MLDWPTSLFLISCIPSLVRAASDLPVHTFGIPLGDLGAPPAIVTFTVLGTNSAGGTTVAFGLAGGGGFLGGVDTAVETHTALIDASLYIETSPKDSFVCAEHPGRTDSLECTDYFYSTTNGQTTVVPVNIFTAFPGFVVVTQSSSTDLPSTTPTNSSPSATRPTQAPSSTSTPPPTPISSRNTAIIAASVVSAVVIILVIVLVLLYLRRRRRIAKLAENQLSPFTEQDQVPTPFLASRPVSEKYHPPSTPFTPSRHNGKFTPPDSDPNSSQSSGRTNPGRKRAADASNHNREQNNGSAPVANERSNNDPSEVALAMRVAAILQTMNVGGGQSGNTEDGRQSTYSSAPPPTYHE